MTYDDELRQLDAYADALERLEAARDQERQRAEEPADAGDELERLRAVGGA